MMGPVESVHGPGRDDADQNESCPNEFADAELSCCPHEPNSVCWCAGRVRGSVPPMVGAYSPAAGATVDGQPRLWPEKRLTES
ncbi:hypothetical protein AWC17_24195 [Mycobacterium nebraskense]|uniref:Uncharacterized protein n=1 Tax=Mycobacterium nebraskense TaxID=244292 RepID=A0A1X2A0A8_9MYCO|nr:hypothetical protein [Mycobacterium nebraskense]KKC06048.1 hypothetical protein WU83_05005 [Mycobacterium nebraskense]MCV7116745.1 hypothetical protein [Mycobacterium nebraskense]ORW34413.1 hypothetical protein AWC17_24195 [Mycobacterium nebraskense]